MNDADECASDGDERPDYSAVLLDAIVRAIPDWVARTVRSRAVNSRAVNSRDADRSDAGASDVNLAIDGAAGEMVERARTALARLFAEDVEAQRANPLQVLRDEAMPVTRALRGLGVAPARRDEFDRTSHPDDVYGIGPLTWRDLGDEVHEAGITWGAWKAATVMSRHAPGSGPR